MHLNNYYVATESFPPPKIPIRHPVNYLRLRFRWLQIPTACFLNKESCWRSNPKSPGLLFWVSYTLEEPSSQQLEHTINIRQLNPDINQICKFVKKKKKSLPETSYHKISHLSNVLNEVWRTDPREQLGLLKAEENHQSHPHFLLVWRIKPAIFRLQVWLSLPHSNPDSKHLGMAQLYL